MATAIMTLEPTNILKPTAEERADFRGPLVFDDQLGSTIDETFLAELDPSWELLPQIDGTGLTPEEFAKIMHRADRVRAEYIRDMPEANDGELNRVGTAAARDALRSVLKARPAAACCDHDEPAPCSACVGNVETVDSADTDEDEEEDLLPVRSDEWRAALDLDMEILRLRDKQKDGMTSFRITDDCGDSYFDAGPELTLEGFIEEYVGRLIANPQRFDAEKVVWQANRVMAVIGMRQDGSPFVTMLDETPDEDETTAPDTGTAEPVPPVRDWFWADEPTETPQRRLTLSELIEREAQRLRDRGNDAGDLMAGALAELARVVRTVSADRPDQVAERLSILERDYSADWEMFDVREPEMTAGGRIA